LQALYHHERFAPEYSHKALSLPFQGIAIRARIQHAPGGASACPQAPHCRGLSKKGWHGSEDEGSAFGLDASHPLAIKGAPSALAFVTSNGEVAAADDAGLLARCASAFDLLRVSGVELDGARGAVSLDKLHGNDAAASSEDEGFDLGGFVHGEKEGGSSRLVETMIAPFLALVNPLSHF